MRWWFVVLLAGCGDQLDPPCAIACDDGCPSGLTCSVGFCAEAGETCEPDLQKLSAGSGFACAVDQFGRAWCWGDNGDRQIADTDRGVFERATVAGTRRWDSVTLGAGHACGLDGGELWCWGRNDRNQVTSAIVGDVAAPIRIEVDGATVEWTKVALGFDYTCGIAGGRLFCWGAGDAGKLGAGNPNDVPRPQAILSDIADWIDVDAGLRHTCAVSKSLGVWCWGDGSSGQLGNARFNVKLEPQSAGLIGATQVAVGLDTSCAIAAGDLFCWGRASQGALGPMIDFNGDNLAIPTSASELGGWVEVAAAERYACGRRDNGEVRCWGTARAGGLGGGRWNEHPGFVTVIETGATALAVGWNGTDADPGRDEGDVDLACATVDGRVQCWGDNRAGQLAQGAATHTETPVEVAGDHLWAAIAAGASHVCGIDDTDRFVYCWGSVELGQVAGLAAGRGTKCTAELCDVATPARLAIGGADELAAGANHTCARSGTELACWGDSRFGQAGADAASPIPPTGVAGEWASVFAGANGTCGSDITASIACFGAALENHLPQPDPELAGATAIGLGFGFGCTLDAAGALSCFGDNANGAFGNGDVGTCGDGACNADETGASCAADCGAAPLTHTGRTYNAIAVGRSAFACGVADGDVECWGDNTDGQIGSFELSVAVVPNPIGAAVGCSQVSAGRGHACAVCGDNIVCWGDARHGEVGAPASSTPAFGGRTIPPPAGEIWATVTTGDGFTCGTTASKRALCWGTSLHGALGNGGVGASLPIAIRLEGGE